MTKNRKISVLGSGSWGTALAVLLADKGYNISMWHRDKELVEYMNRDRENKKYLPDVKFPKTIDITNDIKESIKDSEMILLSIPTHGVRGVLLDIKDYIEDDQVIVNVAKGIENNSLMRISQIVKEILPKNQYAILSGPSHAEEVGLNVPTTVVSASQCKKTAEYVQDVFMTPKFRVYTNPDVIGVEMGGALKNIIALGVGIADGLEYGDNTKAALMTRGIFEMARLGRELGGEEETFSGLAGIGDLIVTCTSMHSRNRRAGILIGQGLSLEEATKEIGMVVEGIKTTNSAYKLAKERNISMPITSEIYNVLYNGMDVRQSVSNLMERPKKHEMENIVSDLDIKW